MPYIKTTIPRVLVYVLSIFLTFPLWGAGKTKDEETLRNAASVLQAMLDDKSVPQQVLAKAGCVIVLPSVKKFAFGVGGSGGRGPMSCRTGKNFSGKWSAPAMYSIGGASAGLQIGGSSTDFVLLLLSQKAVDAVLKGKTKLGHDMAAAAGPSGATSAGSVGGADILTYGRAKGLFAGMSLSGASLESDADANQRLYGKPTGARDIVFGGAIKTPTEGQQLITLLDSKAPKHRD